jgi:glycerophosphoryl diester phosphodiesterase
MIGTNANDRMLGGSGADTIDGSGGDDTILGFDGDSYLRGGDGNDLIVGGADFDDINGNKGDDTIDGGSGGGDWLVGGQGNDLVTSYFGDSVLLGNIGNDTLMGGFGDEVLRGGQDNDLIYGGAGSDWLSGDRGSDTVFGGAGADTFHSFSDAGLDLVADFSRTEGDRVLLDAGTIYFVRQAGQDTVIDMGGGNQLVLKGTPNTAIDPNRAELIAHRGSIGGFGEETLKSFEAAYKAGTRSVELDLQVTKDGQIVLMHDLTIDRTATGTGAVKDLTLEQIKSFTIRGVPGETVPTWSEFLGWAKTHPDVHFYAETKGYRTQADIQLMIDPLKAAGLENQMSWDSFVRSDLQFLRSHGAKSEVINVYDTLPANTAAEWAAVAGLGGATGIWLSTTLIKTDVIASARSAGVDVLAWTVNTTAGVRDMELMGIDRITTDTLHQVSNDSGWIAVG